MIRLFQYVLSEEKHEWRQDTCFIKNEKAKSTNLLFEEVFGFIFSHKKHFSQWDNCMHLSSTGLVQMKCAFLKPPLWVQGVSRCRLLAADLSTWGPGVDPMSVHVGFVVNKTALGQIYVWLLGFQPVIIMLHTGHSFSYQRRHVILATDRPVKRTISQFTSSQTAHSSAVYSTSISTNSSLFPRRLELHNTFLYDNVNFNPVLAARLRHYSMIRYVIRHTVTTAHLHTPKKWITLRSRLFCKSKYYVHCLVSSLILTWAVPSHAGAVNKWPWYISGQPLLSCAHKDLHKWSFHLGIARVLYSCQCCLSLSAFHGYPYLPEKVWNIISFLLFRLTIHNNRDSPYRLEFSKTLLIIPLVLPVIINEEKNYTDGNPPSEADGRSAGHEVRRLVLNPKLHFRAGTEPLLDSTLRYSSRMQELSYYFVSIDHNITLPSKSVCHTGPFPSRFLIRIRICFCHSWNVCCLLYLSHHRRFDYPK